MNEPEIVSMMGTLGYPMVRSGREYHGNCPACLDPEGEDRFVVFADGNAHCRVCQNWWHPRKFQREFFNSGSASTPSSKYSCLAGGGDRNKVRIVPSSAFNPVWSARAEELGIVASDCLVGAWGAKELERRGIRVDSANEANPIAAGLGYIQSDLMVSGESWGVSRDSLWIPQGLLIPTFSRVCGERRCVKLKVRRQHLGDKLPKYIEIPGSANRCMVLGYDPSKPALIVESELDAILCMQEACHYVWCVALGGASKPVDEETDSLLQNAALILWALDQDDAGRKRYFSWRDRYHHLRAWPAEKAKSPGDMEREQIYNWIESGIKKNSNPLF